MFLIKTERSATSLSTLNSSLSELKRWTLMFMYLKICKRNIWIEKRKRESTRPESREYIPLGLVKEGLWVRHLILEVHLWFERRISHLNEWNDPIDLHENPSNNPHRNLFSKQEAHCWLRSCPTGNSWSWCHTACTTTRIKAYSIFRANWYQK